jgi:hypothetical protein
MRRALNIDESIKASKASKARDAALNSLLIRALDTLALYRRPTPEA